MIPTRRTKKNKNRFIIAHFSLYLFSVSCCSAAELIWDYRSGEKTRSMLAIAWNNCISCAKGFFRTQLLLVKFIKSFDIFSNWGTTNMARYSLEKWSLWNVPINKYLLRRSCCFFSGKKSLNALVRVYGNYTIGNMQRSITEKLCICPFWYHRQNYHRREKKIARDFSLSLDPPLYERPMAKGK